MTPCPLLCNTLGHASKTLRHSEALLTKPEHIPKHSPWLEYAMPMSKDRFAEPVSPDGAATAQSWARSQDAGPGLNTTKGSLGSRRSVQSTGQRSAEYDSDEESAPGADVSLRPPSWDLRPALPRYTWSFLA